MTQKHVGQLVGRSASRISRIEGGLVPRVSVAELMLIAAAVGLKLYVSVFASGRRPLDAPQLELLRAFNSRIHDSWKRELEKVMPKEGDLRAIDELISNESGSCAVEAITRFAEVQGHLRPARAKQRDIGATRLILVVKGSRANRRIIGEAADLLRQEFPIGTRDALAALAVGRDPGADCLILL